jgi:hypothetical protein
MSAMHRQDRQPGPVTVWRSSLGALVMAAALVGMSAACTGDATGSASSAEPWGTNTVTPADLVKELASASGADKPLVVCTGPAMLYRSGHVPGAVFQGPAATSEGLTDLTTWAETLPRAANVVIYCGCCPVNDCPNIRPAYKALKDLGFTKVRLLLLPTNFGTDWAAPGYPVEK